MRGAEEIAPELAQKNAVTAGVVEEPAVSGRALAVSGRALNVAAACHAAVFNQVWARWAVALIGLVTVLCYSPVLFNFFVGDDYVHLTWLKEAMHQPELIWRNFHSSWLDGTTTKFYRPLISIFMVTDYLGWGINALGYHITNLVFHLAGSLFLFLIASELVSVSNEKRTGADWLWPVAACALFALHPLHPEAVSWITGRVDAVVTAFCLGSIWFYMRSRAVARRYQEERAIARRYQGIGWLAASIVCFVLGLLSKEMAITVPAVLFAFEFCCQSSALTSPSIKTVWQGGLSALFRTAPFWLLIGVYFGVRYVSLGTFVGGYDDSLLFIADKKAFVMNWVHAFRMTLVPLNKELFGAHSIATKLWEGMLCLCLAAFAAGTIKNKQYRPAIVFCLAWLLFCLVPVYKLFAITDDLQGSRLAYLATAPLSVLLTFGISTLGAPIWRGVVVVMLAGLAACGLYSNNQTWRQAGLESNAIRAALETIYKPGDGDPQTIIVGLPDQIHGAYVCRNALHGMTKAPQLSRDAMNVLMLNEFEPVHPFGYLKDSLAQNADTVRVYRWVSEDRKLQPIAIPKQPAITAPETLLVNATPRFIASDKRPSVEFDAGSRACWNLEFIQFDLNVTNPGNAALGADLLYANDIDPQFKLGHRTHAPMVLKSGQQSLLFSLRSLPQWSLGSVGAKFKLLLPPGCEATVRRATLVPPAVLLPTITFPNSGFLGTKGYLRLGKGAERQQINVDAGKISGAVSTEIEIARANLLFEEQNCSLPSKVARPGVPGPLSGSVELNWKDYKAPGIYEARVWAKDAHGQTVGLASDHIVLSVDP